MWCVAELDDEYIAKMEDVLALYEKPYRSAEPVICLDEKPVSLHACPAEQACTAWSHCQTRQRIQALRNRQHLRCGGAQGRAALTCATPNRSAAQFARVVQRLVADYPFAR